MNRPFTYTDLFNLEYFLDRDAVLNQEHLHERDREIFLDMDDKVRDDRSLLRCWIKKRRTEENYAEVLPGPGEIITNSFRLVTILLSLLGFTAGHSAGLAFFTYTGEAPVNVFHFLILFVFSQFFLLLFVIAAAAARKITADSHSLSGAAALYSYLVAGLAGRMRRGLSRTVSFENRRQYTQTAALIKKVRIRYAKIMLWPFFLLSQKIMIALNLGVLSATLLKIATSDLAFGWQSTLDISSWTLFVMVKFLAAPWSWIVPESLAFPAEKAIEGSRFFLKDGIYHLASSDLVAWWPFLVLCLICYGLIPRLLLFITGTILEKNALNRLVPGTPEARMVLQRMKTPRVSTGGEKNSRGDSSSAETDDPKDFTKQKTTGSGTAILLVPEDIREAHGSKQITFLIEKLGYKIVRIETVMANYDSDRRFFLEINKHCNEEKTAVILIMESWMPPIGDTFSFLKELRNAIQKSQSCYLALLSNKEQESDQNQQALAITAWKTKIDALGDPHLSVLLLDDPSGDQ